jgi:hypothetical protein
MGSPDLSPARSRGKAGQQQLQQVHFKGGLILKATGMSGMLLAQLIAGRTVDIKEDCQQADTFQVAAVLGEEGFAATARKAGAPSCFRRLKTRASIS